MQYIDTQQQPPRRERRNIAQLLASICQGTRTHQIHPKGERNLKRRRKKRHVAHNAQLLEAHANQPCLSKKSKRRNTWRPLRSFLESICRSPWTHRIIHRKRRKKKKDEKEERKRRKKKGKEKEERKRGTRKRKEQEEGERQKEEGKAHVAQLLGVHDDHPEEVLDGGDVGGVQPLVEGPVLADAVQAPYLVLQGGGVVLLVHCKTQQGRPSDLALTQFLTLCSRNWYNIRHRGSES
jgi:hypothetical protein